MTTKSLAVVDAWGNLARSPCAHDNDANRSDLTERGAIAVIMSKANRKTPIPDDAGMYNWRHLVENFFCNIKKFRRIATRRNKTDIRFAALLCLVGCGLATR